MNWLSRDRALRRRRGRDHDIARRERARLARDLHDGLSQDLYASNLALSVLHEQLPSPYRSAVEQLIERQIDMFNSLRNIIERPGPQTGEIPLDELLGALDAIARRELGAGLRLASPAPPPRRVSATLAGHASFALREMLSNAVRHSGACDIEARVDLDVATITVGVDDDGVGPSEPGERGVGLGSLSTRAEQCGGWFRLSGRYPKGSRARWTVPFQGSRCH